jgi:hypothetical protein
MSLLLEPVRVLKFDARSYAGAQEVKDAFAEGDMWCDFVQKGCFERPWIWKLKLERRTTDLISSVGWKRQILHPRYRKIETNFGSRQRRGSVL